MAMQIRKAERRQAKLRLGVAGPSGSGKTYSSLVLALALAQGGKVGLIDTEHGSGDLYAHLGDYDVIRIEAPYTVAKYLEALNTFENAGYALIIIDSLTHAWAGEGGLLDKQGKIADSDPRGNSYTAWRKVTPEHNRLVEAMLASPAHLIATVRSKQEYSQEKDDKGKTVVRKLGMAPVQREGMEYEFTVFLDLGMDHTATASKDRTSLFDGEYIKIDQRVAKRLLAWLNTGAAPEPQRPESDADADASGEERADELRSLESRIADFELSFVEIGTLPELAAQFDAAQKHLRAHIASLGAEAMRPFVERLVAAKDRRKNAIQNIAAADTAEAGGAPGNAAAAKAPEKSTALCAPEDVEKLERIATGVGLTREEAYATLGIKFFRELPLVGYAAAVDKLLDAGKAKSAPAKGGKRARQEAVV